MKTMPVIILFVLAPAWLAGCGNETDEYSDNAQSHMLWYGQHPGDPPPDKWSQEFRQWQEATHYHETKDARDTASPCTGNQ